MKRFTLEQILALYPNALKLNLQDLYLKKNRKAALNNLAGTYILFCQNSGKYYVGSTSCLEKRIGSYITYEANLKQSRNSLILKALLKYGLNSFTLLVLPIKDPSKINLLKLEQELIDALLPEYNILTVAGSSLGFKHSLETRSLLSTLKQGSSLSEETKAKLSELGKGEGNAFFGKKHALETLAKMSKAKMGELNPMFGKEKSPEFIAMQCGENKKGVNNPSYGKPSLPHFSRYIQPVPVYVYDSISKELLMSFPEGIVVAKNTLKIGYDSLKRCCLSNPKEAFTPRKGPLQNRTLIFSHTPLY